LTPAYGSCFARLTPATRPPIAPRLPLARRCSGIMIADLGGGLGSRPRGPENGPAENGENVAGDRLSAEGGPGDNDIRASRGAAPINIPRLFLQDSGASDGRPAGSRAWCRQQCTERALAAVAGKALDPGRKSPNGRALCRFSRSLTFGGSPCSVRPASLIELAPGWRCGKPLQVFAITCARRGRDT
jgi:hypothetical protein